MRVPHSPNMPLLGLQHSWLGMVEVSYFIEGTVWGWGLIIPVSKVGHWQMNQLGVADGDLFVKGKRGTASCVGREEESARKTLRVRSKGVANIISFVSLG